MKEVAKASSPQKARTQQIEADDSPQTKSLINSDSFKYIIYFLLIFTALYTLYRYLASHEMLAVYHSWLASSVANIFHFVDSEVQSVNNLILYHDNPSLEIIADCNGLASVFLIIAAVLPFARPMTSKIVGLAVLIPFLLLFNWLRIFILGMLRFYFPDLFDLFHLYAFQPLMSLVTLVGFIVWIISSESPSAVH